MDKKVIRFVMERETKNTVRFNEVVNGMDAPAIGVQYVQKSALKEIGFKQGDDLIITLSREAISDGK